MNFSAHKQMFRIMHLEFVEVYEKVFASQSDGAIYFDENKIDDACVFRGNFRAYIKEFSGYAPKIEKIKEMVKLQDMDNIMYEFYYISYRAYTHACFRLKRDTAMPDPIDIRFVFPGRGAEQPHQKNNEQ